MAKTSTPKPPKGTPTSLNISALRHVAAGRTRFPNRIEKVDAPHLLRCMRAGLVAVCADDVGMLRLTDAGIAAIGGGK